MSKCVYLEEFVGENGGKTTYRCGIHASCGGLSYDFCIGCDDFRADVDPLAFIEDGKRVQNKILDTEYSFKLDNLRRNRMEMSYYKYGGAKVNFGPNGRYDSIKTAELCVDVYKKDGNTEHIVDAMNYLMLEFMWPQHMKAHFAPGDSNASVGVISRETGRNVNEMYDPDKEISVIDQYYYKRFGIK